MRVLRLAGFPVGSSLSAMQGSNVTILLHKLTSLWHPERFFLPSSTTEHTNPPFFLLLNCVRNSLHKHTPIFAAVHTVRTTNQSHQMRLLQTCTLSQRNERKCTAGRRIVDVLKIPSLLLLLFTRPSDSLLLLLPRSPARLPSPENAH